MNIKRYVLLTFAIHVNHTKIGEVYVPINKEKDIDKWKNPNDCKQQAINTFISEFPKWSPNELEAIYIGDII